jgi:AcrR family transcriptional regulator
MSEPTARREQILLCASALFRRFGYAKTTLADVARSAQISRPTLYAEFADKDSLFDAVIQGMVGDLIAEIAAGIRRKRTLRSQLLFACTSWVHSGHELVLANPEAADLFDPRFEAVQASNRVFERYLTDLISAHQSAISASATPSSASRSSLSSSRTGEMIALSLQGLKRFTPSTQRLDELIETLVDSVCAALLPAQHSER